jgi:hypothetical protein
LEIDASILRRVAANHCFWNSGCSELMMNQSQSRFQRDDRCIAANHELSRAALR